MSDDGRIRDLAWYWLPLLAWMGMIFYLSSQPDLPGPPDPWLATLVTNLGHFVTYAILALWWWRALRRIPALSGAGEPGKVVLFLAFLAAALYAASDEFHQSFVPGRTASLPDLLVDAAGAAAALGLIWRRKVSS